MTSIRRIGIFSVITALLSTAALPVYAQVQAAPDTPAKEWSKQVWLSAMGNDSSALDEHFQHVPADLQNQEAATRFRDSLELHKVNLDRARTKQDEERAKARAEMDEHIAANDLPKALRAAVTFQTLSEDLEAAFKDPQIIKIVDWAKSRLPEVEAELDWLSAQELLFYLRTLYEDTSHYDDYKRFREELDAVNRRVSLLAQYAPKRLHELRVKRAERLGENAVPAMRAVNPAETVEKSNAIKVDMVRAALKTAANEHIEADGWRPLLRGGLRELRLLATTASLDETFPKLGDPTLVRQWVAHIDDELKAVDAAKDSELDSWTLSRILDDLVRLNDRTIQLGFNHETQKVNPGVLYREFGDGALYELDEFSEIIWPDKLPRFKQATEGAFVGVGILIRHNDTQEIVVVNPLEGTPAYFGGVKPNDRITEVDGESTVGWSLNDAVDRITGKPRTDVTLGLQREGVDGIVPVTLQRDVIKLRSVMGWWKKDLRPDGAPEWDWYIDPVSKIAYVKLTQFTDDSHADLLEAWEEIKTQGEPNGLILDLRYNPGGLLTSAVQISNLFVRQGVIVSGEDKDGVKAWADQRANPNNALLNGVPTVILINQGSASASEIVSGCLQAHGAAVVVGERSFGKGSVQTVHPTATNARLKLTTQYYRLPPTPEQKAEGLPGRLVHKRIGANVWGVDPDIVVKMSPQQATDALELRQKADIIPQDEKGVLQPQSPDRPDIHALLSEGIDPQLEKALLILQARALGNLGPTDTKHAHNNP